MIGAETIAEFRVVSERKGLVKILEERGDNPYCELWRKLAAAVDACNHCPSFIGCNPEVVINDERLMLGGGVIKDKGGEGCMLRIYGISEDKLLPEYHENYRTWSPIVERAKIAPLRIASL